MIPGIFSGQSRYRQPDNLSVLNTLLTISLALKMLFTLKATPFIEPVEIKCMYRPMFNKQDMHAFVCLFGLQVIRLPMGREEYHFLFP